MYGSGIFLGLMVLIFFIVGSICGIVALSKIQRLVRDLENVRNQLRSLRDDPKKQERQVSNIENEVEAPTRPVPARVIEPSVVTPVQKEIWAPPPPTPPSKMEQTIPPPRSRARPNLWR